MTFALRCHSPPLVGAGGSSESEDISTPTVATIGGTYHLWYTGWDGSTSRLGHATSADGKSWVKDSANPVLDVGGVGEWDWLNVYSPEIVRVGDTLRLWYSGETLPTAWQTGFAESSNGSDWTRRGMFIPEGPQGSFDEHSADHAALLVEGVYLIWYGGANSSDTYTIGLATASAWSGAVHTMCLPLVLSNYSPEPPCLPDYLDDFSDPGSGWPIYEDSEVKYGYLGGEYQIWLKMPDIGYWVTPGARASDFTAAVTARCTSGAQGAYGILFGVSQDGSQLYEVSIDENSHGIWRYWSGWDILAGNTSADILPGTGSNRIKVTHEGTAISLYINGVFQTTVPDGSFAGFRRFGLSAYSPAGSDRDVRFDDFALYPPSCGPSAAGLAGIQWDEPEAYPRSVPLKPREID